jgi:hypothetical protein
MPNAFVIDFTLQTPAAQDYVNYWTGQVTGTPGALAAAMLSTDTTLTFAAAPSASILNQSLLIENEVVFVTAGAGVGPYTITRGINSAAGNGTTAAAAHASGLSVAQLKYQTIIRMIVSLAITPLTLSIVTQAGTLSSVLQPTSIGGSVT